LFVACALAAGLLALLATPAFASPKTFTVSPNGSNDTADIQAAFNKAVAAGPGSVVQLTAGTFYTNAIWVKGFVGVFRGAGEGVTVIDTPRALDTTVPGINSDAAAAHESTSFLVGFSGGNVTVSGMSVDVSAADPADPWTGDEEINSTVLNDDFIVTDNASAAFDHVSFLAATLADGSTNVVAAIGFNSRITWDENPADALYGYPLHVAPSCGHDSVSDCAFVGSITGVAAVGLTDGSLTVGGSAAAQNSFNVAIYGCIFLDNSDSQIVVSHNDMSYAGGVGVFCDQGWVASDSHLPTQLPPLPAPHYLVADNQIATPYAGVLFMNYCAFYDAAPRLDGAILGNDFAMSGSPGSGACAIGEFATHDILCAHNTFSGTADTGMYLGDDQDVNGAYLPVSGWRILGDDFSGLTASVAPIVLGAGTIHNLVCPTPVGTIDNGVDNWLLDPVSTSAGGASAAPLFRSGRDLTPKGGSLKQLRHVRF
jgi:hypothetical protein